MTSIRSWIRWRLVDLAWFAEWYWLYKVQPVLWRLTFWWPPRVLRRIADLEMALVATQSEVMHLGDDLEFQYDHRFEGIEDDVNTLWWRLEVVEGKVETPFDGIPERVRMDDPLLEQELEAAGLGFYRGAPYGPDQP